MQPPFYPFRLFILISMFILHKIHVRLLFVKIVFERDILFHIVIIIMLINIKNKFYELLLLFSR
jgi:hypothetical protein